MPSVDLSGDLCGLPFPLQGFVCPSGSLNTTLEPSTTTLMDPLTMASSRSTAAGGAAMARPQHQMLAKFSVAVSDES